MFYIDFEVRDNEVDIQGVVNNANYFIYMAHTRHKFLDHFGINFAEMASKNQNLFLLSCNIEFKKPLKANDIFYVTCKLIPEGKIKFAFEQEIRLKNSDTLISKAVNVGVCMNGNTNRPYIPEKIQNLIQNAIV